MPIRRTKIVATVGPSCSQVETLARLILAGVNVFRLNMAHGNMDSHSRFVDNIRAASEQAQRPVGILADLAGPKLRLGNLAHTEISCEPGDSLVLRRGTESRQADELVTDYPALLDEIHVGDKLVIGDGTICLEVTRKSPDEAFLLVVDGGTIRSRQGLALPNTRLSIQTIGPADFEHAEWAANLNLDFISLSFVRDAEDLRELRRHIDKYQSKAAIIAKIEKRESLEKLDEIVAEADGIMVARGDLGLEIDIASTAVVQKKIIALCRRAQKPVIVATQMLESMHESKRPTRAEVSDVSNAILDGADACMLSGETAVGKYPVEAVQMMARIQLETEPLALGMTIGNEVFSANGGDLTESVLEGAAHVARCIDSKVLVIATKTGRPAIVKSKLRDRTPTLCITDSPSIHGQGCLWWGVIPWLVDSMDDESTLFQAIIDWNKWTHILSPGDRVVIVSDRLTYPAGHDSILVYQLPAQ